MKHLRIDIKDDVDKELHNKCDDCCLVIGCHVCGPCALHDGDDLIGLEKEWIG